MESGDEESNGETELNEDLTQDKLSWRNGLSRHQPVVWNKLQLYFNQLAQIYT